MRIGDANFNRLKAPLQLSISRFGVSSRHIENLFGKRRWSYGASLKIERWGGCRCELALWMAMQI
jgi:hypothetical protein